MDEDRDPALDHLPPTRKAQIRAVTAAATAMMMVSALGILIGVAYLAYQSVVQSQQNFEVLKQTRITNQRLISCSTPGGKCYQQNNKRTAKAIVGVNNGTLRVVAAALSCQADGVTETEALAKCTAERAQQAVKKPKNPKQEDDR